jgi:adenylate kinase family enzyme
MAGAFDQMDKAGSGAGAIRRIAIVGCSGDGKSSLARDLVYQWRAFRRMLLAFGQVRPDLAPRCQELFDLAFYRYIAAWNRVSRPKVAKVLAECAPGARLIRLASDADKAAFLADPDGWRSKADDVRVATNADLSR